MGKITKDLYKKLTITYSISSCWVRTIEWMKSISNRATTWIWTQTQISLSLAVGKSLTRSELKPSRYRVVTHWGWAPHRILMLYNSHNTGDQTYSTCCRHQINSRRTIRTMTRRGPFCLRGQVFSLASKITLWMMPSLNSRNPRGRAGVTTSISRNLVQPHRISPLQAAITFKWEVELSSCRISNKLT
jgi:hypothetical protein